MLIMSTAMRPPTMTMAKGLCESDPIDEAFTGRYFKAGQMFEPVRVAVCGRKNAPPLFETLEVLGQKTTLARLEQALQKLT